MRARAWSSNVRCSRWPRSTTASRGARRLSPSLRIATPAACHRCSFASSRPVHAPPRLASQPAAAPRTHLNPRHMLHASIVNEHVQPAIRDSLLDHSLDLGRLAHVRVRVAHLDAVERLELLVQGGNVVRVSETVERDVVLGGRERRRDAPPDARRRACDEGVLACCYRCACCGRCHCVVGRCGSSERAL